MSYETRRVIKLEKKESTFPVSAKCCLWFAWAADGLPGVQGETPIDQYRPVEIDVENISQVTVSVNPNHKWSHHPGVLTNAAGFGPDVGLQNPGYRDPIYNSQKIKELKAPLNMLVGMVATKDPPIATALDMDQIKIGLGKTITINNISDTRLFLGFHDGRHWTNNDNEISVTITIDQRR